MTGTNDPHQHRRTSMTGNVQGTGHRRTSRSASAQAAAGVPDVSTVAASGQGAVSSAMARAITGSASDSDPVQHQRLAPGQQFFRTPNQLAVGAFGVLGRVNPGPVGGGRVPRGVEAGEFLAHPVARQQHGTKLVGEHPGDGRLATAG
jgi:hypothetical protein